MDGELTARLVLHMFRAIIPEIVVDTNVVTSALRSRRGASYRLLSLLDCGRFGVNLSVPLLLEYERVAKELAGQIPLTEADSDGILDYLCQMAAHQQVLLIGIFSE